MNKHLPPASFAKNVVKIDVIGVGGTGSALLPRLIQLHYAMLALGHPEGLHVTAWDGDIVSNANIGRQAFFPQDVGHNKALLLINRLNLCWGTQWAAMPRMLAPADALSGHIIIGCVDSRKARNTILSAVSRNCYYIDSGNSARSGQVLIGQLCWHDPAQGVRLPPPNQFFPELFDALQDATDELPSCSLANALMKQSLAINGAMAFEIFNLLVMLLIDKSLPYMGAFVNLETGSKTPMPINPEVWKTMFRQPIKQQAK